MNKLERSINNLDELIKKEEEMLNILHEELTYLKDYREALCEADNEDLED